MTWKNSKSVQTITLFAATGLLVSACSSPLANGPQQAILVEQKFPISVEPQMTTIGVRIDPGLQRLDPADVARVEAFADHWKERGQGAITVSAPQGSPNQRAGESALMQTVSILTKSGVPQHMISRTGYPASTAPGEPPVTMSFMSLTAVAPDCAALGWPDNLAMSSQNTPWTNFGCSTQSNFAAMVSNPRDLIEPQPMAPADATRRGTVMQAYREGKSTQTKRSKDESGKVTDTKFGDGQAD